MQRLYLLKEMYRFLMKSVPMQQCQIVDGWTLLDFGQTCWYYPLKVDSVKRPWINMDVALLLGGDFIMVKKRINFELIQMN